MKFQHTRRGETQTVVNKWLGQALSDNKTKCHSKLDLESHRMLLSNNEILNQVQDDNYFKDEALNLPVRRALRAPLRSGFTLMELLVVMLIIGILAAVALPQYQKTVERSKATQGLTLLRTLTTAYQAAYLEKGSYPSSFAELDIDFPFTGNEHFVAHSGRNSKSNSDWILEIENESSGYVTLFAVRNSGKYKGAGFGISLATPTDVPRKKIYCIERTRSATFLFDTQLAEGAYCQQVIQGSLENDGKYGRSYNLP